MVGADRYRNPDDELPADFDVTREDHYAALEQAVQATEFVVQLRQCLDYTLKAFNASVVTDDKVKLLERGKGSICLSPLEPQPNLSIFPTSRRSGFCLKETHFRQEISRKSENRRSFLEFSEETTVSRIGPISMSPTSI